MDFCGESLWCQATAIYMVGVLLALHLPLGTFYQASSYSPGFS